MSCRRKWQPTPVLLPGESHGRRSLVGSSPQGRKESDMTERLHFLFLMLSPHYCIVPLPRRTCKQPVPPHRGKSIKLCPPYTVTQVGGLRPLNGAHFLSAALSWAICRDSPGVLGTYWRGQDPGCHSPGLLGGIAACKWPPSRCSVPGDRRNWAVTAAKTPVLEFFWGLSAALGSFLNSKPESYTEISDASLSEEGMKPPTLGEF